MPTPLTIWSNAGFPAAATELLQKNLGPHRLIFSAQTAASNLVATGHDPLLAQADVAFGQPDPRQIIDSPNIKWVQLTSAGYTRYDTPAFRAALQDRGGILTNSSTVYSAPCAEHILAMMLALARQLPQALDIQRTSRAWRDSAIRAQSRLLDGQIALIYGFGAIARRLVELLTPLRVKMTGVRRNPAGNETLPTITPQQADALLPRVDHVINILPASTETECFFNADRFGKMKRSAIFYNIGRGSTVDQYAMQVALETGRLHAAYLDVSTPEPLPPDHPLWHLPNCFITPHSAGGQAEEFEKLAAHFLGNLHRYAQGQILVDRVM
jgi:phosphoglycerate dehydrogenase-like enzyme